MYFHDALSTDAATPIEVAGPRATACDAAIPGGWIVAAALLSVAALLLLLVQSRMSVDPLALVNDPFYGFAGVAVAIRYAFRAPRGEGQRIARDACEYFGLFALICLIGALASYPAAADSRGFSDAWLEQSDRMMRFDWLAWYDCVAAHPSLQILGIVAYRSVFVTPAILLGYFAWTDRKAEARRFIAGFWLAAIITLLLFSLMPAEGPLAFLSRGRITYMPTSALYQAQLIPALRDHALYRISLGGLHGLVSAPSFHTVSAVLFIATAWPISRLRWPLTLLNLAMLVATPVEGTHYLADMIAGALVGVFAFVAVALLSRLLARKVAHRAAAPLAIARLWSGLTSG